jgi:hypothetical protein
LVAIPRRVKVPLPAVAIVPKVIYGPTTPPTKLDSAPDAETVPPRPVDVNVKYTRSPAAKTPVFWAVAPGAAPNCQAPELMAVHPGEASASVLVPNTSAANAAPIRAAVRYVPRRGWDAIEIRLFKPLTMLPNIIEANFDVRKHMSAPPRAAALR